MARPRFTAVVSLAVLALATHVAAGCATPTSVIEIPACADRVEVVGQASRLAPQRFELDHTFELPLTKSVVTFQAGSEVKTVELVATQPDPFRLFAGALAGVAGGLLLASASHDLANGHTLDEDQPFYEALGGGALVAVGAFGVLTGWHPPQRYVSFPEACLEGASPNGGLGNVDSEDGSQDGSQDGSEDGVYER